MLLFRGKNKVTNEWAYGDLYQSQGQTFIMQHNGKTCEVDRETVSQTAGVKDERGDDVYVPVFLDPEPAAEFHEGELIVYQNGCLFEIGKIKRIVEDGAFVYYHEGDTVAKTPFDCMRKIVNAHIIKETSFATIKMNDDNLDETKFKTTVVRLRTTESEAQMFKEKAKKYGCKTISDFIRLRCLIQDDPKVLSEENERNDI